MNYYLGLDVGGTKTFCLIGDDDGNIKGFGRGGAGSYEVDGVESAIVQNRLAIDEALDTAGLSISDISGIGMGIAGADLPEDYVMLEREIYAPLFGGIPRMFRNDSMGGLRAGTRHPVGIVIACGTGCVCAGRNQHGDEDRVGGLGPRFGDECSGEDIGLIGLRRVWQARDGIIPPTLLTQKFVDKSGYADLEEFFIHYYRGEITPADLEPMAKLVFDAALEGDEAANDILEVGGTYLAAMVNACARKLSMTDDAFDVVMTGSVFNGSSPVLREAMSAAIHTVCPQARPVIAAFEPVVGALLLGMEVQGIEVTETVYENLTEQLLQAEKKYNVTFTCQ